jgi:hypothetical protein
MAGRHLLGVVSLNTGVTCMGTVKPHTPVSCPAEGAFEVIQIAALCVCF